MGRPPSIDAARIREMKACYVSGAMSPVAGGLLRHEIGPVLGEASSVKFYAHVPHCRTIDQPASYGKSPMPRTLSVARSAMSHEAGRPCSGSDQLPISNISRDRPAGFDRSAFRFHSISSETFSTASAKRRHSPMPLLPSSACYNLNTETANATLGGGHGETSP
jgi:hypothetical protein